MDNPLQSNKEDDWAIYASGRNVRVVRRTVNVAVAYKKHTVVFSLY